MTKKTIRMIALVVGVLMAIAPAARADELDLKTVFTVNQPVRIPGNVVLPAGAYIVMRPEPIRQPNLVRIMDVTENKVYSTFFGVPNDLLQPSDKARLIVGESPAGTAQPLTSWYYPGKLSGIDFPQFKFHQVESSN